VVFFDPFYIVIIVATLVISGGAQLYIRSTYAKWNRVPNGAVLTGAQVAEVLRERARFGGKPGPQAITAIKVVQGELSDHFDPRDRSLSLSQAVASRPSVVGGRVGDRDVGHAAQLAEGSAWMQIRSLLVPAAMVGPQIAYLFIIGGLILNATGLFTVGILLFGIAVLFSVATLPVEIQASQKALAMLQETGIITSQQERNGARSMLTAAALTYVAAAVTAILTLLYYITLARRN